MENQNNDYSSVVETIASMFGDVITKEVICTIVESFEGDLNLSVEAVMNITSDTKNVGQSEEEVTSSNQLQVVQIPSTSQDESPGDSSLAVPSTSYASASNKGAIPKQTSKPKTVNNKAAFWTEQIRQIIAYHNQGARVLIILRGAPGSGKTFLAKQIIEMTIGSTYHAYKKHTFSTDDFFVTRGQYQYDKSRLSDAHTWNQNRVRLELCKGLSPVIVDNTNIELWEMEPYVRQGVQNGYYIEVVEPNTYWAKKANQLCKRNVHNVPFATIKRMLENYQDNISGLYLIQAYGLLYPENMAPPVLRNDPPLKDNENAEAEAEKPEEKTKVKTQSDLTEFQEEFSSVLKIQETSATEGLTEAIPQGECLNINEPEQNCITTEELPEQLHTNIQESSPEELSQHEIIKQQLIKEAQKRLEEMHQVETAWENGESWDDDSKKYDTACSKSIPMNTEPKPPRKQDNEESILSANILDSVSKCDDWSQISMFMPSWHDIPQHTVCNEDKDKDNFVEKISSSTCIEIGDTDIVNNKHNYKIITATPKDINMFHVSFNNEKIPDIRSLDKSTMTYEHTISEAYRCKNEEQHFASFRKMFKNVARSDLRDIFDKCRGDVNWAVDIVLDSMNNKLLDMVENEESSDKEEEIIEQCECLAAYNIIPDGVSPTPQNTANIDDVQDNASDNRPQVLKKSKKDTVLSDSSMQLKRQIEKNVNIADNHYSAYCLKLRKMRHGEVVKAGTSSSQPINLEGQDAGSESVVVSSEATTASVVNSDEEEESTAECIDEPAKVVNVNVGMEFITMLDDMFGRKDMIYPNNVQPSLTISVSVLNELNASWMESLMYQLENESKQMQEIIKQDEEFARELALKEEELLIAGMEPAVPDFKEIMDMDLALSLYQKDLDDWRSSEPQDLAAKMTREKLYNLFPEVSPDVLAELLVAHHNNFQATVESLLISTGRHDILEQENGVNKFVMEKEMQRQKKILELEKEAFSEDESPLLPKGERATMAVVNGYRHEAEEHLKRRNANHEKAHEFIRRGMTQVANHYSSIASYHKQRFELANSFAAAALIQVHAQNNPNNATIDLHYMRVAEAKESLDIFLDFHIRRLQENQNRGPRFINLFFITGRGLHSHGQPRIKPAVKKRLRERFLAFSERNPGLLTARVCADDRLSYQISNA
ncbi:hypothetical protein O3G_MSEX005137 [Manduca sexta]|uniref:NEDD4-binding protein 2 n=1 Tax=Manduca sexta TaxID=7130 RepID=A0A922CI66_MANSE|nr:hypothetical protein O3G_MSEX005137 [Manduca sexta]